jgi:predicted DNA-binding protein (MmcQ/YjbR family)
MTLDKLRAHCLSHPGATEQIQWGADLVFKVGGKMFCVACTEPAPNAMSFKCDDETFAELIEREGAMPAPYLAKAKWVALETFDTLPDRELTPLVTRAYEIVRDKLPQKTVAALTGTATPPRAGGVKKKTAKRATAKKTTRAKPAKPAARLARAAAKKR